MMDFYGWMYEIDEDTYHGSWGNIRRITQWVKEEKLCSQCFKRTYVS